MDVFMKIKNFIFIKFVLSFILLVGIQESNVARAEALTVPSGGLSISALGVQDYDGLGLAIVKFSEASAPTNCGYGNFYINLTTNGGKSMLSTLLYVQGSGKKINTVGYYISSGICYLNIIQF